jgi:cyanophycinase
MARRRRPGKLVIVGGREDKEGDRLILRFIAEEVGGEKLVVATVASEKPDELWDVYERLFRGLGVRHVHHLNIASREEARSERKVRILRDAQGVFFTGGDQLRITSQLGDTPVYERIREIHAGGGLIAGTSAGASVVCETMLVSGDGASSPTVAGSVRMAPGLGLLRHVIIDQHFAERGRMGRLVAAVAQNPRILGIGIDEDTAIIVEGYQELTVLGKGAVYVVDGSGVSYTNLTEEDGDRTLTVLDVRLHLLSQGDRFDLESRRPCDRPAEELEEAILGEGRD